MRYRGTRIAPLLLAAVLLVAGCGEPTTQSLPAASPGSGPSPVLAAAVAPSATAVAPATFAPGSLVATVDVGGLQQDAAAAKLRAELAALAQPLDVLVGSTQIALEPQELGFELPLDALLREATAQASAGKPVQVPLRVSYEAGRLRERLGTLASQVAQPGSVGLITQTERISRTFVYHPGRALDLDAAMHAIDAGLRSPSGPRRVTLALAPATQAPAPDLAEVQRQVEAMAKLWRGVVGVSLYDMRSGKTVQLHQDTVFSGASVMKIPIMLQSYLSAAAFSAQEETWLNEMIEQSNNLSANSLLAHVAGGESTDDALVGVRKMNQTLAALGLQHTFQSLPYEAGDYLIKVRKLKIPKGPAEEGAPPFTEADPYVRTTPAEMGRLLVWITQCSQGTGPLLEQFGATLSAQRCGEMIDHLKRNDDATRMLAGLPPGAVVAHKSGWVEDMQADVGLVSSPGGDFVLAIYLYQPQRNSYLADEVAAPVIAAFARMVYSAYNPVLVP